MQQRVYFAEPAALMSEPILSLYKSPLSGNSGKGTVTPNTARHRMR